MPAETCCRSLSLVWIRHSWIGSAMSGKRCFRRQELVPQSAKMPVEVVAPTSPSEQAELQARALALLGSIAVERYTSNVTAIAERHCQNDHGAFTSDKGSDSRTPNEAQMLAVAIELLSDWLFNVQHYFDAAEVVRSLFALSTSTSTSSSTSADGDLRNLARAATLQIAAENTPSS